MQRRTDRQRLIVGRVKRGLRRRERRALARPLETDAAGARPRDDVALGVGNRHHGVVERRLDVRQPVMHDALFAALLERLLALVLQGKLFQLGSERLRYPLKVHR